MGDPVPPPATAPNRDVFIDGRGDGRVLRVSWHQSEGMVVISLWEWDHCRATFRLAPADVPDMIDLLASGLPNAAGVPGPAMTPPRGPTPPDGPFPGEGFAPGRFPGGDFPGPEQFRGTEFPAAGFPGAEFPQHDFPPEGFPPRDPRHDHHGQFAEPPYPPQPPFPPEPPFGGERGPGGRAPEFDRGRDFGEPAHYGAPTEYAPTEYWPPGRDLGAAPAERPDFGAAHPDSAPPQRQEFPAAQHPDFAHQHPESARQHPDFAPRQPDFPAAQQPDFAPRHWELPPPPPDLPAGQHPDFAPRQPDFPAAQHPDFAPQHPEFPPPPPDLPAGRHPGFPAPVPHHEMPSPRRHHDLGPDDLPPSREHARREYEPQEYLGPRTGYDLQPVEYHAEHANDLGRPEPAAAHRAPVEHGPHHDNDRAAEAGHESASWGGGGSWGAAQPEGRPEDRADELESTQFHPGPGFDFEPDFGSAPDYPPPHPELAGDVRHHAGRPDTPAFPPSPEFAAPTRVGRPPYDDPFAVVEDYTRRS